MHMSARPCCCPQGSQDMRLRAAKKTSRHPPQEFLRLLVERRFGGIEAYRTMWSLGTDCAGGEQLWGSVPLSLSTAGRVDSIAGSSSSHWVAWALPPTSVPQARPGRRAQLPLGEMALLRKAFLFSSRLLDPSRPKSDCWLGLFQFLRSG